MQTICTTAVILTIFYTSGVFGGPGLSKSKGQSRLPKGNECGFSPSAGKEGRIVGGEEAVPHSWPWQVYILCTKWSVRQQKYNGGSLISNKWVMTAANTLVSTEYDIKRDCRVLLGKHNVEQIEPTQMESTIDKLFVHEKYNKSDVRNGYDLGLIKLKNPMNYTNAIRPICLPFDLPDLPVGATCYVTGWGRTVFNVSKKSPVLKQLSMPVQEYHSCGSFTYQASRRVICTGLLDRGEDACTGDFGGPLSCQEQDRNWYLRGIISTEYADCDSTMVSTKVTAFQEWIENMIDRN